MDFFIGRKGGDQAIDLFLGDDDVSRESFIQQAVQTQESKLKGLATPQTRINGMNGPEYVLNSLESYYLHATNNIEKSHLPPQEKQKIIDWIKHRESILAVELKNKIKH